MDFAWLDFAWKVLITVLNFAGWIWMYLANRDKVTNSRISSLENNMDMRLDDHGSRLTTLESDIRHGPTHNDLGRLHARIDEVNGALKGLQGESKAQTRILNMVYESLIDRKTP